MYSLPQIYFSRTVSTSFIILPQDILPQMPRIRGLDVAPSQELAIETPTFSNYGKHWPAGAALTAIRERVYSPTFLHATSTTMKRNTLGRSAGGLSNVKAPPARPASLHTRYMHEKRQLLRGTYLPLRLPVHPSVHTSMPPVRAGLLGRGAPFARMLMPAAFRDAIQFSSLTPADLLLLRRVDLRVKVRATVSGSFRRR